MRCILISYLLTLDSPTLVAEAVERAYEQRVAEAAAIAVRYHLRLQPVVCVA